MEINEQWNNSKEQERRSNSISPENKFYNNRYINKSKTIRIHNNDKQQQIT